MLEPRGHADMYGAIITEPEKNDADFGVIFMHNDGYSTGCGHAVIGITKTFVETGLIKKDEPETTIKMDVPSGHITSFAQVEDGKVISARFINVPSFVDLLDAETEVLNRKIKYDLAFGGAYYAIVNSDSFGLELDPENVNEIIDIGMNIKQSIMEEVRIMHPTEPEMNFLYGTIFTGPPKNSNNHSRNVCIFAEGEVDRSPTGTGVSARAAIHYARGEIGIRESITIESIIGSTFSVKVDEITTFGKYQAVVPEVRGTAFLTGKNTFWINPNDPLKDGFILR